MNDYLRDIKRIRQAEEHRLKIEYFEAQRLKRERESSTTQKVFQGSSNSIGRSMEAQEKFNRFAGAILKKGAIAAAGLAVVGVKKAIEMSRESSLPVPPGHHGTSPQSFVDYQYGQRLPMEPNVENNPPSDWYPVKILPGSLQLWWTGQQWSNITRQAPGWYFEDAFTSTTVRYWDGYQYTGHTQPRLPDQHWDGNSPNDPQAQS